MNYTLHQLQVFLKVTQMQSITKAAEELHLTQPAVSIQLKNFQAQFNIPLTEIIGRKIYITAFGKEIAIAAETIIDQVYAINYKTATYNGQLSGRLKISVVSTGNYVMPYFLADFLNENPSVECLIDVTNKRQVIESLSNNEVDFALVSIIPAKLNIEKIDLLKNRLFLVGNPNSNNGKKQDINILRNLPMLLREEGSGIRQTMIDFLARNDISINKKMELTSNEAVKQAIISGMGFSIMPLVGIKNELINNDLQIIPVQGLPITTTWSLIWMKGKKLPAVAIAYLDYLNKNKVVIADEKFGWCNSY